MGQGEWKPEYATGIPRMDFQHQILFELLEHLFESVKPGEAAKQDEAERVLVALLNYARVHFDDEVELMTEHHYPKLAEHVEKHEKLLSELSNHLEEFRKGNLQGLRIAMFLRNWASNHVQKEDQDYGLHICSQTSASDGNPA